MAETARGPYWLIGRFGPDALDWVGICTNCAMSF